MQHSRHFFFQPSQYSKGVSFGYFAFLLCLLAPIFAGCSNTSGSRAADPAMALPPNSHSSSHFRVGRSAVDTPELPAGSFLLSPGSLRPAATDNSVIDAYDKLHVQVISTPGASNKHRLDAHDVIRTTFSFGSEDYHILPGDELSIQFQENAKLDLNVTVRPDGRLTLPGLGEAVAAGQTPLSLARQINEAYAGRMTKPDASVIVVKANTAPIDALSAEFSIRPDGMVSIPMLGELKASGYTPADFAERLSEVASRRFKNNILAYVTTRERSALQETLPGSLIGFDKIVTVSPEGILVLPEIGVIHARRKTLSQVRRAITKAAESHYKTPLQVAVIIEASEHRTFFVSGEVNKQGAYPLTGKMTTIKALAVAGGVTNDADISRVALMHYNSNSSIIVYLASVKAVPGSANAFTDIALSPQDVIFVPKTKIAKADLWVQQYIEKLIPVGRTVSYSYSTIPSL